MTLSTPKSKAQNHTFIIYWWAKTEAPRKRGHDVVELPQEELTEDEADAFLSEAAGGNIVVHNDYPALPNFEKYYPLATFCESFGVVRVVKKS